MKKLFFESFFVVLVLFFSTSCKEDGIQGGLEFNSKESFVDLNFSPEFDINSSFTFEMWVNFIEKINRSSTLLGPLKDYSGAYGLYTSYQGRVSFGLRSGEDVALIDFKKYELNTWYHLAGVYNGKEKMLNFYVNGQLVSSSPFQAEGGSLSKKNLVLNGAATIQGRSSEKGYTKSIMRDVRIWNIVRTKEQIETDMNKRLKGTETGLIGYWPLNEKSGNIANDLTKNNNGTVVGARWYFGE